MKLSLIPNPNSKTYNGGKTPPPYFDIFDIVIDGTVYGSVYVEAFAIDPKIYAEASTGTTVEAELSAEEGGGK